ncbi:MAG: hypothetical protein ABH867_00875, partial [Patescibacteria group bacterium]
MNEFSGGEMGQFTKPVILQPFSGTDLQKERCGQINEAVKVARQEIDTLSPVQVASKVEEFVDLKSIESKDRVEIAKSLAGTVAQMVHLGRNFNIEGLEDIAAYYYQSLKLAKYP